MPTNLFDLFPDGFRKWTVLVIVVLVGLTGLFRFYFHIGASFPLNDGGLFYIFTEAIAENGLRLPEMIFWNGYDLPFAYPPLSFWAGAWVHETFGIPLIEVVRWYPMALQYGFLVAYLAFLRVIGLPWSATLMAFFILAFSHRSFEWLIMGGGMSRATGACLAMTAGVFAVMSARSRGWLWLFPAGVFSGLAALAHLEWGIVSAVLIIAVTLFCAPTRPRQIALILATGTVSFLTFLPWLVWVIQSHGADYLMAASQTSGWGKGPFQRLVRMELFPSFLTFFGAVGAWQCIRRREYFWPLLTSALLITTPRHYDTVAPVANSVMIAIGIMVIWRHITDWVWANYAGAAPIAGTWKSLPRLTSDMSFALILFVTALHTFWGSSHDLPREELQTVTPETVAAMEWVNDTLPDDAMFIVLSYDNWPTDQVNEWFPAIARRQSLTTVQGAEWLPDNEFGKRVRQSGHWKSALSCPHATQLVPHLFKTPDFIFTPITLPCLNDVDGLTLIYDEDDVFVYEVTEALRAKADPEAYHADETEAEREAREKALEARTPVDVDEAAAAARFRSD